MTLDRDSALCLLASGEVEVLGLLPYSSNYTFLARVREGRDEVSAVYKPRKGERPLWDFPPGTLASREVAAFVIGEAAGWGIVPPTVLRDDAPLGPGSLQLFIDHDPERHYFVLMEERRDELAVFAAFDVVVNNADRKSGHVLEDPNGRLWAVDHGVTFHQQPKLRTVIWDYAEERVPQSVCTALEILDEALSRSPLSVRLAELISADEVAATKSRVETLLVEARFPGPVGDRPLPWPLI